MVRRIIPGLIGVALGAATALVLGIDPFSAVCGAVLAFAIVVLAP